MNNYDAGITMDTFVNMPIYMAYMVKMTSLLLSHPMELMRVNIQANVTRHRKLTMTHMFKKMSRRGLQGYYYGIATSAIRFTVHTICTFTLFNELLELIQTSPYFNKLKPLHISALKGMCGVGGGILATPFAKLSIMRQADVTRSPYARRNYRNFSSGLRCMFRKGGLNHLFTGWEMNALSSGLVAEIHKPVSDHVEGFVVRFYEKKKSWIPNLMCLALKGGIIAVIMTPIDTLAIMTLNQSRPRSRSYYSMCRRVIRKHGYKGFFSGLKPILIGIFPNIVLATAVSQLLLDQNLPETPPNWGDNSSEPDWPSWPPGR